MYKTNQWRHDTAEHHNPTHWYVYGPSATPYLACGRFMMYMQHKKNVRYEIGKFGIDQMTWHGLAQCTIGIVNYSHMTRIKILAEFLHLLLCHH